MYYIIANLNYSFSYPIVLSGDFRGSLLQSPCSSLCCNMYSYYVSYTYSMTLYRLGTCLNQWGGVAWGLAGVGLLAPHYCLSHFVLNQFCNNLVYCIKEIVTLALVFPEAPNFFINNRYMRIKSNSPKGGCPRVSCLSLEPT